MYFRYIAFVLNKKEGGKKKRKIKVKNTDNKAAKQQNKNVTHF